MSCFFFSLLLLLSLVPLKISSSCRIMRNLPPSSFSSDLLIFDLHLDFCKAALRRNLVLNHSYAPSPAWSWNHSWLLQSTPPDGSVKICLQKFLINKCVPLNIKKQEFKCIQIQLLLQLLPTAVRQSDPENVLMLAQWGQSSHWWSDVDATSELAKHQQSNKVHS